MNTARRAEIRTLNVRPCLYYGGVPLAYGAYWIRSVRKTDDPEAWYRVKAELCRPFAERGIHFYENAQFSGGWSGPEAFDPDFSEKDNAMNVFRYMEAVLEVDPEALFILNTSVREPAWWREAHPDELEQNVHGTRFGASLGSQRFREDAARAAARFVEHVENASLCDHVFAYNVWFAAEGFSYGCLYNALVDVSPAMQNAFRAWLRCTYRDNVDALRENWTDSTAAFETAAVPDLDERRGANGLSLLDPSRHAKTIDYYTCLGDCLYETWTALLGAAKTACDGRALVGAYGGYVQAAGWSPNYWGADGPAGAYDRGGPFRGLREEELHTHLAAGQFSWTRILEHPACDFLASPYDYYYRKWGAPLLNQALGESAQLRNKLFIINEDTRTHLHGSTHYSGSDSPAETWALYRRNFAAVHTTCNGCNWMEQGSNWLQDPEILDEVAQFNRLMQRGIHWADEPSPANALCVVIDEESLKYQAPFTDIDFEGIYKSRVYGLSHCGVPLKIHALRDIEQDRFPAYRSYIFLNLWYITPEKLALLREKILRDGNAVAWQYAPGYLSPRGASADAMAELTGMEFDVDPIRWEHLIAVCDWQHALTRDLPADCAFGTARRYGPVFRVKPGSARQLGYLLLSQGRHETGLAVKAFGRGARRSAEPRGPGDFVSIFCEAPLMPAGLVRNIARLGGAHVYSEQNDVLYAGRGILAVHAAKPGMRRLRLPRASTVWDLYARARVAENVTAFDIDIPEPSTRVFYLGNDPWA